MFCVKLSKGTMHASWSWVVMDMEQSKGIFFSFINKHDCRIIFKHFSSPFFSLVLVNILLFVFSITMISFVTGFLYDHDFVSESMLWLISSSARISDDKIQRLMIVMGERKRRFRERSGDGKVQCLVIS